MQFQYIAPIMTEQEWEAAKERGRKTNPARILNEEAENFFGYDENVVDLYVPEPKQNGLVARID